jgi:hypothetical protein
MSNLSIPTAELVTTMRTVPKNGAPSSDDYNATNREILADLATISSILNDSILPVLNALPDTAAQGLDGRAMYAGLDSANSLFYSASAARYVTVAEVLISLATADSDVLLKLNDLGARVISLQSKLASTSQNDILSSVQAFSDQVRQVQSQLATALQAIDGQAAQLANSRAAHAETGEVAASGPTQWTSPGRFPSPIRTIPSRYRLKKPPESSA